MWHKNLRDRISYGERITIGGNLEKASSVFQFPSYYYYYNGAFQHIFRQNSVSHPLYRPTQT